MKRATAVQVVAYTIIEQDATCAEVELPDCYLCKIAAPNFATTSV